MFSAKHNNQEVGSIGEDVAVQHLKKLGFLILERNYRVGSDEIDIISRDSNGILVFVEVKTMSGSKDAAEIDSRLQLVPEDQYSSAKQKKVHRACSIFIAKHPELIREDAGWRIDLITLTINTNNVIINTYENV